ncbi:TPA: hypothetical protein I8Y21_004593 [Klebsiella oxytoca]|uniref:Phage protein n=1 Tax=Klebsiella oxytoca TaxID=571 RepID=A0AAN5RFJ3_KLEOX|nr:hypothetical protein [Klebsiella oxytoca]
MGSDMAVRGTLNRQQLREIKNAIARTELTPAKKKRLLWRIGKNGVIPATRANAREQHTPDGRNWPGRAKGHGHKKMMRKLPGMLGVRQVDDDTLKVVFRGGKKTKAAVVAWAQQHGASIRMSRSSLRNNGKGQKTRPATRYQAKKLITLGFTAPEVDRDEKSGRYKKLRKRRRVSMKWIVASMNMAQAGLIIRALENKTPADSWIITLPARAFLGITDEQVARSIARELRGIQFGSGVKAQDIRKRK